MDKMIKVSEATHKGLKVGASNCGLTMKQFLSRLAKNNKNGIPFDVDMYSTDDLIAVLGDIIVEFNSRHKNLTKEEKKIYNVFIRSAYQEIITEND